MSFSNINYDKETYQQSINQSVGPGVYHLAQPSAPSACNQCYPVAPDIRLQKQGNSHIQNTPIVDVQSELYGITRKLSKNVKNQYIPSCPNSVCNSGETQYNLVHRKDCFIPAEDTRLSNPSCNLRGTGWNRWEWLCNNPQDRVEQPYDWNIQNRILVKDNHRPCIPNPIDQTPALPHNEESIPCSNTTPTCSAYTDPASVSWQTASNLKNY